LQNAIYSFSVFFITVAVFSVAVFAANREYVGIAISGKASAYSVGRSFCDVEEMNDIIRRLWAGFSLVSFAYRRRLVSRLIWFGDGDKPFSGFIGYRL